MRSRVTTLVVILAMSICVVTVLAAGRNTKVRDRDGKTREHTIYTTAKKDNALGLGKFARWIDKAGVDKLLNGHGDFTVFAPNNAAINTLSSADSAAFWTKNDTAMANAAKYCVVEGRRLMLSDLMNMNGQMLTMANGQQLPVTVENGKVRVGNASIVDPDHPATNGVIHVIDAVLVINKMMPMTTSSPTSAQQREHNAPMAAPTPMGTTPMDSTMMRDTTRVPAPYGR